MVVTKTANKNFLNILSIESITKAHWQRNVICTQPHNFFSFLESNGNYRLASNSVVVPLPIT